MKIFDWLAVFLGRETSATHIELLRDQNAQLEKENVALKTQTEISKKQLEQCRAENEKLRKRISGDDFGGMVLD